MKCGAVSDDAENWLPEYNGDTESMICNSPECVLAESRRGYHSLTYCEPYWGVLCLRPDYPVGYG